MIKNIFSIQNKTLINFYAILFINFLLNINGMNIATNKFNGGGYTTSSSYPSLSKNAT